MRRFIASITLSAVAVLCLATLLQAFPKPSPYPLSWELKFDHSLPKRILVTPPGSSTAQAYWYMTYTVTNNSGQEQMFLPVFEMLMEDGRVVRADKNIPTAVFDAIKAREHKRFLEPTNDIAGRLLIGEDQARDGVAIWPEPDPHMGRFTIFVSGLSGEADLFRKTDSDYVRVEVSEAAQLKDVKPEDVVVLRKTLKLEYDVPGDEVYPGIDRVNPVSEEWVMR